MRKTSVNLTEKNVKKMEAVIASEGITQTDFINNAIDNSIIVCLGDRKTLAQSFADLVRLSSAGCADEMREEVINICQSLNSLVAEIRALKH